MSASERLEYQRLFDSAAATPATQPFDANRTFQVGDQYEDAYVYDDVEEEDGGEGATASVHRPRGRIELAVNVAMAAGRPLLVRGLPGTGKSSLAKDVARRLGWRYYEHVVSSRTQARDLLWTFDAVKRLSDAQAAGARRDDETPTTLKPDSAYITPGVLWWAFNAELASQYGKDPSDPPSDSDRAVVLIDEIDKADPDMPNDLLVPLGSFKFRVVSASEPDVVVEASHAPLVFITTNEERDLPQAFLRRCVTLVLDPPGEKRLLRIARAHFNTDPDDATLALVLKRYKDVQARRKAKGGRQASVAEFLDAVAACRSLGSQPGDSTVWQVVEEITLDKPDDAALRE